ncbi:hypothetical protein ACLOAV_001010 [Pseudogymnoascus australis]
MSRLTRSVVAARTRTTRSKAANSKPGNPKPIRSELEKLKASAKAGGPVVAGSKRKRDNDMDDLAAAAAIRRQRQYDREGDNENVFRINPENVPWYPLWQDSGEENPTEEDSVDNSANDEPHESKDRESADDESREATGKESGSDGSEEASSAEEDTGETSEESSEDDSEDEDSDKEDGGQPKGPDNGVSKAGKSTSHNKFINDIKSGQDEGDINDKECTRNPSSIGGKGVNGYPSNTLSSRGVSFDEPIAYRNGGHPVHRLLEEEYNRLRVSVQDALETILPIDVAAKISNEACVLPMLGQPWSEVSTDEDIVDDNTDDRSDKGRQSPIQRTAGSTTSTKTTVKAGKEFACPPMAIQPGSQVTLAMSDLRSTSSHQWDVRKHPSIFATETGGKWNPPPDDPSLSIHENRKNLLIRRALKWPLLTSGYESPESFQAAKVAEARMDVAVEYYLTMYRTAPNHHGEYMIAELRKLILVPARAALDVAVGNLKQPALVPSRSGSVASVRAPVLSEQVSITKPTAVTAVGQGQQRQSPCKKPSGPSGLQSPEPSSPSTATAISSKPRSHLEKLPAAKLSSTKTSPVKSNPLIPSSSKAIKSSPAKTSQAQPVVPSPTRAAAKKSPTKAILPPSSTPSTTSSMKASPTKTALAKPSILPSNKAPAVVSKSQTQPEKAKATKSPAKPSPAKPSRSPSASFPRKDSVEVSASQKQQRTGWIDLSAVQSRFLSPVASWSSEARVAVGEPQIQRLLESRRSPKKRCLPSSPTSTSSSGSESSSSSPNPSQFPSPSPLQPKARTINKGKASQILSREKATARAERSLTSSPVETQEVLETNDIPSTAPRTPARQDTALELQIQIGLEEMQPYLREIQRAKADTDSALTGRMAHMISLLIKAREAGPGSSTTPLTIDED